MCSSDLTVEHAELVELGQPFVGRPCRRLVAAGMAREQRDHEPFVALCALPADHVGEVGGEPTTLEKPVDVMAEAMVDVVVDAHCRRVPEGRATVRRRRRCQPV